MARKSKTMKGNSAAAYVSYAFTEVAAIYPITPSSDMAEETDAMSAAGVKNIFGQTVKVAEMQSEAGAAGAVHGSLAAGALTTTYTASQGLLLMIPNMYKIAGELLPNVIDVSARCVATHALNIFGDHSDIYACRQTGYAMLCSNNVQEVMDLGAVAHLSTIKSRVPFVHFFDGFRTSHEIQKINVWDYQELAEMVDMEAVNDFRRRALNPEHPVLRGSAQNPDIFFQAREACNPFYDNVVKVTEDYLNEVNRRIGTKYKLFNYYGARDAEHIIIAMGSVCDTAEETVDYLNAHGEKVGLVKVHLYRPFSAKHLVAAIPATVKRISVLDRTKEPGSLGEPLWLDVVAALKETKFEKVPVYGGRYGLGSKDTNPSDIIAVYRNMEAAKPKKRFTISINDDVTNLSLKRKENPDTTPKGTFSCKFWGLGADGTVGANQNSIKIIGDNTDMYAQGYFAYDSKKSGGITISHLRFGKKPIKSSYYINQADFVACHNPSYVDKYKMVEDLKKGGKFLLNCSWNAEELGEYLPASMKRYIAQNAIELYTIDATSIAKEIGLGGRVNTILQAAFFKLTGIIKEDKIVKLMKDAATKSFSKKGEEVVAMNHAAIDRGFGGAVKVAVPAEWAKAKDETKHVDVETDRAELKKFVSGVLHPVNAQQGDSLPVSVFAQSPDGTFPQGSAAFEKRGIAVDVPNWIPDNCIQCNFCSYVCPHAVIRPFALTEQEAAEAPEGMKNKPMNGVAGLQFAIAVSALDCYGCGSCANVCPGMKGNKALVMQPLASQVHEQVNFNYALSLPEKAEVAEKFKDSTVKGSQFKTPLLEFSGACAGCGETPYAKLATQLFGDRMFIANATGCSSIWGGSAPSTPYTVNKQGKGPAWANSLFEDNAEYSFGMMLANHQIRTRLAGSVQTLAGCQAAPKAVAQAAQAWLDTMNDGETNGKASRELIAALEANPPKQDGCAEAAAAVLKDADYLAKKSFWAFGGDGWAYDIGFGGLDHVIAQNEDVNILIFDTEVYSNTGGQSSKSTPTGAVAKFAAAGKTVKKKDLARMAMSYGYVYVAQVAMGADYNQCVRAFKEAESYNGPSVIIAYAPCINHGIKGGMGISQTEEKDAVAAGYWHNFRFDPRLAAEGKNPFTLDSKAPAASYRDFIMNEVRYSSLLKALPAGADDLLKRSENDAKEKYDNLVRLQAMYEPKAAE
ncbi:MAG TPA: pyruvate:ferredoxin (flavodoxin) oxidoreductase [Clostridiales bacterium]|nr:MAG: Pyruvate-flavodoxin oxidoreductase [Firmicutes bacterium ADurb.Bin262]HOU09617.1 pyruvate:ferredoxin (flavodoxin) oxidoreductase [Clostridiales bacterium]HQK74123.1 pyruvate:ferredoxin (flavodoxin) oxidoreductase [Clostridiales bacterium]